MLREHLERRRVRKTLGKLVGSDMVDEVIGGESPGRSLTASNIEFVLVSVRFETPQRLSELIGRVIEICLRHEASIDGLSGSVVVAAFGVLPCATTRPGATAQLVADLVESLGADVRIVHGSGSGYYGCFGSGKCSRFSFVVPRFESSLALLDKTEFGRAQEFKT